MRKPPDKLHEFLRAFAPDISTLFLASRRAILTAAPEANELIYDAYNAVTAAYSFSDRLKEAFCHVAAYAGHVNLGFNRGAELRDASGLLVGTGALIRHIRISTPADLRAPALQALVRAAVIQGRGMVPSGPSNPASIVRPTTGDKAAAEARGVNTRRLTLIPKYGLQKIETVNRGGWADGWSVGFERGPAAHHETARRAHRFAAAAGLCPHSTSAANTRSASR